ncbi:hypothetical protein ELH73_04175 [Rhizobium leguminosarum]|jgi:hypothetical protein|nr:hypothetical protein ELI28_04165 [Rhizobium leguminosarum]TAV77348.1 hypothetical protein ELI27_04165 [Rhizobium leguminosarum]TAY87064.1 hypothetical protein ELH83_04200 [Rhizobium leguminosarum]TAY97752.1 hypothetical protein ELH79_04380 [Rhizobium leguminosarum]TAZ08523.1 hypothetical protein ELH78_04380 [Rhizobium leguminosarum]
MREEHLWRQWQAWFPVMPIDNGMFGLEAAWRGRKPQTGRLEFRSLRTDREKGRESAGREF